MRTNIIDQWFLDLSNPSVLSGFGIVLYVLLTLVISAVLSVFIGLERYLKGENAGMRTHALLSVGCAFLMSISIFALDIIGMEEKYDISRIAAGTVTGIGFLGAGVIIKDRFTVKGLSTATTLWICAAIGLATGAGFVLEAVIATLITMFFIWLRNRIIVRVDKNAPRVVIKFKPNTSVIELIRSIGDKNELNIRNINIVALDNKKIVAFAYFPYHTNPLLLDYFCQELKKNENVLETTVMMKKDVYFEDTHES